MKDKDYLDKEKIERLYKKKLSEGDYPSITLSIQSRLAMDSHDEEPVEETFEEWLSKFDSYDEEYDVPIKQEPQKFIDDKINVIQVNAAYDPSHIEPIGIFSTVGVDAADVLNLRTEEEMVNNTAVHAKWEYVNDSYWYEEIDEYGIPVEYYNPIKYFKCSCCGQEALMAEHHDIDNKTTEEDIKKWTYLTKYCPHCGAKMENGEDYEDWR